MTPRCLFGTFLLAPKARLFFLFPDAIGSIQKLKGIIQAKWYDGIKYKNRFEGKRKGAFTSGYSYIAFSPTQIKSALGNRGTFSPTNPNILREPTAPYALTGFTGVDSLNERTKADIGSHLADTVPELSDWTTEDVMSEIFGLTKEPTVRVGFADPNELRKQFKVTRRTSSAAVRKYREMLRAGVELDPVFLKNGKFEDGGNRVEASVQEGRRRISTVDIGPLINMDWKQWLSGDESYFPFIEGSVREPQAPYAPTFYSKVERVIAEEPPPYQKSDRVISDEIKSEALRLYEQGLPLTEIASRLDITPGMASRYALERGATSRRVISDQIEEHIIKSDTEGQTVNKIANETGKD